MSPTPRLVIDRDALARNFHVLQTHAGKARVAAVVKADSYGLGAASLALRLRREGCRCFFVATTQEGADLRRALDDPEAEIFVFHGYWPSERALLVQARLTPVINSPGELAAYEADPLPGCALNFDTGMNRLGLSQGDAASLLADRARIGRLNLRLAMSHLAVSDSPAHPMNGIQLERFRAIARALPGIRLSLSNTAGVLLGPDYHFDIVRPGIGLYGGNPSGPGDNPFEPVVQVEAPILQIREIAVGETIGYGATFTASRPMRTATLALGYADGMLRAASPGGYGRIAGHSVPLVGRISMDFLVVDITDVSTRVELGDCVSFLGPDLDALGNAAGTIGYELLTRLGSRLRKVYRGR